MEFKFIDSKLYIDSRFTYIYLKLNDKLNDFNNMVEKLLLEMKEKDFDEIHFISDDDDKPNEFMSRNYYKFGLNAFYNLELTENFFKIIELLPDKCKIFLPGRIYEHYDTDNPKYKPTLFPDLCDCQPIVPFVATLNIIETIPNNSKFIWIINSNKDLSSLDPNNPGYLNYLYHTDRKVLDNIFIQYYKDDEKKIIKFNDLNKIKPTSYREYISEKKIVFRDIKVNTDCHWCKNNNCFLKKFINNRDDILESRLLSNNPEDDILKNTNSRKFKSYLMNIVENNKNFKYGFYECDCCCSPKCFRCNIIGCKDE